MSHPRPAHAVDPITWFPDATSHWTDWPTDRLLNLKEGHRISVVIPAKNESSTIGAIVTRIRSELVDAAPLIDELVVIDSDSTDATVQVARAAGASVYSAREIRPELGTHLGKGEALWKSQFVTSGDLMVFIDADLTGWGTHFISGLLGPLLSSPAIELVKGYYDRVLDDGTLRLAHQGGGRVTELVARPLLNLFWPALSRVVQPLAGEWAIRRSTFTRLSIPIGYGVEIGALLDVFEQGDLPAIAQVDLGEREHSHQSVHDLAVMAAEIIAVANRRRGAASSLLSQQLWQFDRDHGWRDRNVPITERPPHEVNP